LQLVKIQNPKPKIQANPNDQYTNHKQEPMNKQLLFGFWDLYIAWILGFGFWDLYIAWILGFGFWNLSIAWILGFGFWIF
jgi:hypothetical protein